MKPFCPTWEDLEDALTQDDNTGWCRNCGEEAHNVEPDAQAYTCESCGERAVYGASEFLVREWIDYGEYNE